MGCSGAAGAQLLRARARPAAAMLARPHCSRRPGRVASCPASPRRCSQPAHGDTHVQQPTWYQLAARGAATTACSCRQVGRTAQTSIALLYSWHASMISGARYHRVTTYLQRWWPCCGAVITASVCAPSLARLPVLSTHSVSDSSSALRPRASPKSQTFKLQSALRRMLDGFRSLQGRGCGLPVVVRLWRLVGITAITASCACAERRAPVDDLRAVHVLERDEHLVDEELQVLVGELLPAVDDAVQVGLHQRRDDVHCATHASRQPRASAQSRDESRRLVRGAGAPLATRPSPSSKVASDSGGVRS